MIVHPTQNNEELDFFWFSALCKRFILQRNMDITPIFRAKLESVGNRHKALADSPAVQPRKILPTKKTEYYSKAKELVATLNSLRTYLLENRAVYLDVTETSQFLPQSANAMTELERDQMDLDVQKVIHTCQGRVQA